MGLTTVQLTMHAPHGMQARIAAQVQPFLTILYSLLLCYASASPATIAAPGGACSMYSCFSLHNCKQGLTVYIHQPLELTPSCDHPKPHKHGDWPAECFLFVLQKHFNVTNDPAKACLLVPGFDTSCSYGLCMAAGDEQGSKFKEKMTEKLRGLPHWAGGRNHLLLNYNMDWAEPGFKTGEAIVARASWEWATYRSFFDVQLPLLHHNLRFLPPEATAAIGHSRGAGGPGKGLLQWTGSSSGESTSDDSGGDDASNDDEVRRSAASSGTRYGSDSDDSGSMAGSGGGGQRTVPSQQQQQRFSVPGQVLPTGELDVQAAAISTDGGVVRHDGAVLYTSVQQNQQSQHGSSSGSSSSSDGSGSSATRTPGSWIRRLWLGLAHGESATHSSGSGGSACAGTNPSARKDCGSSTAHVSMQEAPQPDENIVGQTGGYLDGYDGTHVIGEPATVNPGAGTDPQGSHRNSSLQGHLLPSLQSFSRAMAGRSLRQSVLEVGSAKAVNPQLEAWRKRPLLLYFKGCVYGEPGKHKAFSRNVALSQLLKQQGQDAWLEGQCCGDWREGTATAQQLSLLPHCAGCVNRLKADASAASANNHTPCSAAQPTAGAKAAGILPPNATATGGVSAPGHFYGKASARFVLAPRGLGAQSYSIIEAIAVGSIPVIYGFETPTPFANEGRRGALWQACPKFVDNAHGLLDALRNMPEAEIVARLAACSELVMLRRSHSLEAVMVQGVCAVADRVAGLLAAAGVGVTGWWTSAPMCGPSQSLIKGVPEDLQILGPMQKWLPQSVV